MPPDLPEASRCSAPTGPPPSEQSGKSTSEHASGHKRRRLDGAAAGLSGLRKATGAAAEHDAEGTTLRLGPLASGNRRVGFLPTVSLVASNQMQLLRCWSADRLEFPLPGTGERAKVTRNKSGIMTNMMASVRDRFVSAGADGQRGSGSIAEDGSDSSGNHRIHRGRTDERF